MIDPMPPQHAPRPYWRRHPLVTVCGLLCLAWFLANGWYVTVAVLTVIVVAVRWRRRRRARAIRHAGLRARADLEHRFACNGDPRGVYGRYPPVRS
jgi:hypothetical protein